MGSKISCSTCNGSKQNGSHGQQTRDRLSRELRRDGHVLRLWAEVFHVSASSGAVRWTQLSDDLVPVTVTQVQQRYHVTAYNSRVDKVLDTWLSATRLGQASNCFVYWKDPVSGDTWGLNFTSAADARAFRECISASRDFRRAESSYSLREKDKTSKGVARDGHSTLSSGYQNRAHSQPNSPSKQKYLKEMNANQCTCDCMTSDVLHKQRNGRIRYSTFTRQDSSGTTQSSKSDGSLVRRQQERQQYFARSHVRSMEEQMRQRTQRETQSLRASGQVRRQDADDHNKGQQQVASRATSTAAQLRSKSQEDVRRVATTATTTDDLMNDRVTTTTASSTLSADALKRMLRDVSTTTTSSSREDMIRHHDRPKSLSEVTQSSSQLMRDSIDRSRSHRSLEGRRRSLERSQCVDFTDASPPTPRHRQQSQQMAAASVLDDYETELRRCLASQSSQQSVTRDDAIDAFETLLKESMDDVASLMREVQHELTLIRAEEKRFKSLSTQSLIQLSRSSAPILDTLSIDGQLPFLTGSAGHSTHAIDSALSIGSMMTSSEVSDDEKASLTTAISDDDDLDLRESPLRARSGSSAANFECLGSVRKSGFLSVKKWLLRKRHSLELARKRGWKGYWVCLKGTTLLFYNCESRDGHAIDAQPKHLIFVDACLVQSIPEHPKRDHVFCLSTAFGDAYLLDAPCLTERDSWIAAIHCACAAQLARNSGRAAVGHILAEEISRLERTVETDTRSRHETELLLTCITDEKQKQSLVNTIMVLEEKVEKTRVESFRLKCYSAALTNDEMPNPKTILSLTNRRTKSQLNRLGVFTVSSLHAFNCAKNPSIVGNLLKRQKSEEKETPASSLMQMDDKLIEIEVLLTTSGERRRLEVSHNWTVDDLLLHLMSNHVNSREYYVSQSSRVLSRNERLSDLADPTQTLEVIPKVLFTIELSRDSNDVLFGFSVESELIANDLCVYVSRVENQSIAASHGLKRFDELVVINGALVSDLDMMFVESVLQEELTLCLMIRSSRTDVDQTSLNQTQTASHHMTTEQTTDELIESLVCPPPPPIDQNSVPISDNQLDSLIVPKVESFLPKANTLSQLIHYQNNQPKSLETQLITSQTNTNTNQSNSSSNESKMRKVVKELIDTEVTYCNSLEQLMSLYLEPLSQSSLLSQSDVRVLFGSIVSIIANQKQFKEELQSIASREDIDSQAIDAIAKCFLSHSNNFRNYSTFCASHSRAVKLLSDEKTALHDWLVQRSSGQLAQSLESFLIKPIQRVLKYPLLLSQMKSFCQKDSKEYQKLNEALKAMEKVAEHINEMQRIHEEYGAIFEHLARNYNRNNALTVDLSPTALIHYGGVEWINSVEFLGKNCRKGVELHAMCFVFNQFVVFLCKETIRHRKRVTSAATRTADVEIIRHQTLIPVIEVQVRACPQSDNEHDFKWELIQLKTNAGKRSEKIYRLSNSTCEYRNAFLRTIRQIIREDVRQMSVLSTKPKLDSNASQTTTSQTAKESNNMIESQTASEQQLVSCGLCGKDVSIGCRSKEHSSVSSGESPIWKRRQDSNSSSR